VNNHVSKYLSAFSHGELEKMHNDEVRAHLDECQRCQDEFVVIREGIQIASQLQCVEAPEVILQEIEKRLVEPIERPLVGYRGYWWRRLAASSMNPSRVAAIALLVIITAVSLIYLLRTGEKSKFVLDMSPFLEIAETSDDSTLTNISTIRPDGFFDVSQHAAYEALGFPGNTQILPVNGFELAHQRIRDFGNNKVVQFVFRRQGRTFIVFVAPPTVAFVIGERKAMGSQIGALRAGKVERGLALSVFWGAAKVHCASISGIGSSKDLASLIQPLNDAFKSIQ